MQDITTELARYSVSDLKHFSEEEWKKLSLFIDKVLSQKFSSLLLEDREDLRQDLLKKLVLRRYKMKNTPLTAYCRLSIRNIAYDFIRKRANRMKRDDTFDLQQAAEPQAVDLAWVSEAIKKLPKNGAEILENAAFKESKLSKNGRSYAALFRTRAKMKMAVRRMQINVRGVVG